MLFLSYAEEDRETAGQVARWLEDNGYEVFSWEDPRRRGREFIKQIERALQQSDAFLVLLSPSFLASDWCRRERDVAIRREQELQSSDPDRPFIYVLQIIPMPGSSAGFLGSYDWLDLTNSANREETLGQLAGRLPPQDEHTAPGPQSGERDRTGPPRGRPESVSPDPAARFRNREDELEKVLRGLTSPVGPHFCLVSAPPQLGKTWFLRRVATDPQLDGWVTTRADLRELPAGARTSPAAVLGSLSGAELPGTISPQMLQSLAQEIARSRRPHLWLLDSVELMDRQSAAALRSYLSRLYGLVREDAPMSVRLAVIVASRREDEWRGVTPAPRVSQLALTEFSPGVVEHALRDLARDMERPARSDAYYAQNCARVYRLTEGLPALLVRCLDWIKDQEWFGMERLESQELFEELTGPYIQNDLLARQSLFPGGQVQGDEPLRPLAHSFRVLVLYRLFTMSHLRHHFETDPAFSECLREQQWTLEYLLKAISGTALLSRPLNEPWQEIHPAIRRLLYRHYYKTQEERVETHTEARKFVEEWAGQQPGIEQVVGLVECLWHEATELRLRNPAEMERILSESARTLSRGLQPSSALTVEELRDYATQRIKNDQEMEETVSIVDGLFTRLAEIVATPL